MLWIWWGVGVSLFTFLLKPWSYRPKKTHAAALSSTYDCQCGACENHL